jgi:hypothetical protein
MPANGLEDHVCKKCGRKGWGPDNLTGPSSFFDGVCSDCRTSASSSGKATKWGTKSMQATCLGCDWEDDAGGWPRAVAKAAADHHRQTGHGVKVERIQVRRTAGS